MKRFKEIQSGLQIKNPERFRRYWSTPVWLDFG